jgi:antagonist of KipI
VILVSAGFQTTVQDSGRLGFRKFGVAVAGALDPVSLRLMNLVVGNDQCAAGLEIVSGRLRLEFEEDRLIAWCGGEFEVHAGGTAIPQLHCARISAGAICEIKAKRGRAWLAISGGIEVPEILSSRSTDLRAGFGGHHGRALRDRDKLSLGDPSLVAMNIGLRLPDPVSDWSAPRLFAPRPVLRVIRGRRWDDFDESVRAKFLAEKFRVGMNSDRMGLRLEGERISNGKAQELPSEAVAPGTIQIPRDGAPIVLLADCQTIGGYPKIAHVITVDLARAAQLQALDEVGFELTTLAEAQELLLAQEKDIALFRAGLQARFA